MSFTKYNTEFFNTKLKIKNYPEDALIYKTIDKDIVLMLKVGGLNPAFMDMKTIIEEEESIDTNPEKDELLMFYNKETGGIIPTSSINKNLKEKTIQMLKIALANNHDSIVFDNYGNQSIMMNVCKQFSKLFKEIAFISDSDKMLITSFEMLGSSSKPKENNKKRREFERNKSKMLRNRRKK